MNSVDLIAYVVSVAVYPLHVLVRLDNTCSFGGGIVDVTLYKLPAIHLFELTHSVHIARFSATPTVAIVTYITNCLTFFVASSLYSTRLLIIDLAYFITPNQVRFLLIERALIFEAGYKVVIWRGNPIVALLHPASFD